MVLGTFLPWKFLLIASIVILVLLWFFFSDKEGAKSINNDWIDQLKRIPENIISGGTDRIPGEVVGVPREVCNMSGEVREVDTVEVCEEDSRPELSFDISSIKGRSIGERKTCMTLSILYDRPFRSKRMDEIRNPFTNSKLEIDCYDQELMIGAEYNGIQHYKYPNKFHKTLEEFEAAVYRDTFKESRCEELGIYLIKVPYTIKEDDIPRYVYENLPEDHRIQLRERAVRFGIINENDYL